MFWMGVDVGTGGTRALLIDADARVHAAFTSPHADMRMERPGWAEQDPENWWEAASAAVRGVLARAETGGESIAGVGLTGQMHGLVVLDDADRVIRPSLIWCDQRSQAQVDAVEAAVGRGNVVAWTANPPLTGFTLPKLLWVRDHEPERFRRVRKVLLPKDYVRLRMTGEHASDVSDASGTGLFDVARRTWSRPMLDAMELDAAILPRVVESDAVTGRVTRAAAEATGLPPGTPVVGGAGDQAAGGIGNGIVEPGVASATLGTSGVVFVHMDAPAYDAAGRVHTFCHAVPGAWHVMGVTQAAGLSLRWLRDTLVPGAAYAELMSEAERAEPGCGGLYWLPYLMGERTPHLDASARGGWIGMTARHTRADLIRALVEGVAYSQKDCLDVIEGMGVDVGAVRISGGGARSPFWRQVVADVLGTPVVALESEEGAALGAALLALAGVGGAGTVSEVARRAVRETALHAPDEAKHAVYRKGHAAYRSLYPALRDFYRGAS